MSAAYIGQTRTQRKRRKTLEGIRARLGDCRFADFITDNLSENGAAASVEDLPGLVELWVKRQDVETDVPIHSLTISKWVGGRTASAQVPHVPAWLRTILRAEWMPLARLGRDGPTRRVS